MANLLTKLKQFLFRPEKGLTTNQVESTQSQSPKIFQNELKNFEYFSAQSIGRVRTQNEDSLFTSSVHLAGNERDLHIGLFIIADGMGGHHHGEIASSLAVAAIAGEVLEKLVIPLSLNNFSENHVISIHELLGHAISQAQNTVTNTVPGAGTTLTIGVILNQDITIAHIGDSRCYLQSVNGQIKCLTSDHSFVNRLVDLGQITKAEAENHPQKNILYKAVGQKGTVEADIETFALSSGDVLLFCSDGLWGQFSHDTLQTIIQGQGSLAEIGEALVTNANESGGPDNISLILVRVP